MTQTHRFLGSCVIALALASGCSGTTTGTDAGGVDTGTPPSDTNTPAVDTGIDAAASADDTGVTPVDAGADVGPTTFPDGAIMCLPGVECTNWEAAITAAPRDASNTTMTGAVANCVVQLHRADCCGASRAYGVNHGGRTDLCTAETACRSMYPATPDCSSNTITVDTGDTTTSMDLVRVRGVPVTPCSAGACVRCETVVCDPTDATCLSLEGISAGQCG